MFLTTKMPNPHYSPEVQVKISLVNFTVTQSGLEEQLLGASRGVRIHSKSPSLMETSRINEARAPDHRRDAGATVELEMPELAEKKSELVVQSAAMNKQLFDIESSILKLLAESKGNILDDTNLIETLAQAKKTSNEVNIRMQEAEVTAVEVNKTSEEYRPVAKRASLLYFCLADMANVDPMYQYARGVLRCLHFHATRLRERWTWVVSFLLKRPFRAGTRCPGSRPSSRRAWAARPLPMIWSSASRT